MNEIGVKNFVEILKQGYSLNNVYILQKIREGREIVNILDFPIGKAILQGMERKMLISSDNKILPIGEELLNLSISTEINPETGRMDKVFRQQVKKERDDAFSLWWSTFPGTDTFQYKGKTFPGSRALRTKKEECRPLFEKILKEGFTAEDMLKSLEYEVIQKKEDSIKKGENKLRFMQNSLTYLRQRTWEPYIELVKSKGDKAESQPSEFNSVNI